MKPEDVLSEEEALARSGTTPSERRAAALAAEGKADGKDKREPIRPGRDLIEGPQIYATLPLLQALHLPNGGEAHEVVVYRPTCGFMTQVLDTPSPSTQAERFVEACCRAVNGTREEKFSIKDLNCIDGAEFSSIIQGISQDADSITIDETGDGITSPMIYTLKYPVKITPQLPDSEVVEQFAFEARKVGDISEYLDARGETREFHTFMRTFGKPLGIRIPVMHDLLINALDVIDYLVIRRQILPKFTYSRNRWKKASSLVPSITTGRPAHGTN